MPYVTLPSIDAAELLRAAEGRWTALLERRPDLQPAVDLQRSLLSIVVRVSTSNASQPLPTWAMPAKYVATKLAHGTPALAGEPIPFTVAALTGPLLALCNALAAGGAGDAARHIATAIESRSIDSGSLLAASLSRDQNAIRQGATHRGLAPDLLWLIAELAISPFAHTLQRSIFASAPDPIAAALDDWGHGYCPACGSWPALAEVEASHRILRCSFCAAAWELQS